MYIRDPEADRLARELAARTGQPITRVVVDALRDKLKREQSRTAFLRLKDEIMAISRRTAARHAFRVFGKGKHPAALNFGACFSS